MTEWLYGHHPIHEALRAGRRRFQEILLARGGQTSDVEAAILDRAQGISTRRVQRGRLDNLVGSHVNHQGIAARVSSYPYADWDTVVEEAIAAPEAPFLLLLDRLQDPQNLGTLLRTAEAVGVHGVAIPKRRAASITPAVSKSSAGAIEHLAVAQITNMARTISQLKEAGVWVFGLEQAPGSQSYQDVDLSGPLALVVGSEGTGLKRLVRERCDVLMELPMLGRIGSLNAAVAGSVALYLALQARDKS